MCMSMCIAALDAEAVCKNHNHCSPHKKRHDFIRIRMNVGNHRHDNNNWKMRMTKQPIVADAQVPCIVCTRGVLFFSHFVVCRRHQHCHPSLLLLPMLRGAAANCRVLLIAVIQCINDDRTVITSLLFKHRVLFAVFIVSLNIAVSYFSISWR